MNKTVFKISLIIIIAILFIITGLFFSIKLDKKTRTNPSLYPSQTVFASPTSVPIPINLTRVKATKVIDGDTIELADKTRVRYIGINTPELATKTAAAQCFATQSAYINRQLAEGQEIGLEKDVSGADKYGRLLRYIYIDGVFINEFLVRQGYARVETIPPDVKYKDLFLSAEKEARENKRGLWKECGN